MNFRYMRIIVSFDLPTLTSEDKREYRKFKRFLDKSGYVMLQESVYSKLALNGSIMSMLEKNIEKNKPKKGNVMYAKMTENQYSSIKYVTGEYAGDLINTPDRYIEL